MSDLLANRDRFTELRCKIFFIFFKFIIALFVHEILSRELVMLFFESIRREIERSSRRVFDFKRSLFFLFFVLTTFQLEEIAFELMSEFVNNAVNESMSNRNILETICDSFTKYNLNLFCRACSIFFLSSRRTLQFDDQTMCSRFSHVSHILYFSVIVESHSLMRCFMTHFLHTTMIRQCFSMCSYF